MENEGDETKLTQTSESKRRIFLCMEFRRNIIWFPFFHRSTVDGAKAAPPSWGTNEFLGHRAIELVFQ